MTRTANQVDRSKGRADLRICPEALGSEAAGRVCDAGGEERPKRGRGGLGEGGAAWVGEGRPGQGRGDLSGKWEGDPGGGGAAWVAEGLPGWERGGQDGRGATRVGRGDSDEGCDGSTIPADSGNHRVKGGFRSCCCVGTCCQRPVFKTTSAQVTMQHRLVQLWNT